MTEVVHPEELDALANKIASTLGPLFERAHDQLEEDTEVNGPAFSQYGIELAELYPTVQQFALRDLETKSQNIASIIERLGETARTYAAAEDASTIRSTGGGRSAYAE